MCRMVPRFGARRQQDSVELLRYLIEALQTDHTHSHTHTHTQTKHNSSSSSGNEKEEEDDETESGGPADTFRGCLKSSIRCLYALATSHICVCMAVCVYVCVLYGMCVCMCICVCISAMQYVGLSLSVSCIVM